MDTHRIEGRRVALGVGAITLMCGATAIMVNFGILNHSQREPVGQFVQAISNHQAADAVVAVRAASGGSQTTARPEATSIKRVDPNRPTEHDAGRVSPTDGTTSAAGDGSTTDQGQGAVTTATPPRPAGSGPAPGRGTVTTNGHSGESPGPTTATSHTTTPVTNPAGRPGPTEATDPTEPTDPPEATTPHDS